MTEKLLRNGNGYLLQGKVLAEVQDHPPKSHTHGEADVEFDVVAGHDHDGVDSKQIAGSGGDMLKSIYDPDEDGVFALPQLSPQVSTFKQVDHDALPNPHHPHTNDPTDNEKAALYGTDGVPSGANKFVTNSDPRNANARTPTSHAHPESEVTNLIGDLTAIVTELGNKSEVGHGHAEAEVANLVSDLAGKSPVGHTHAESEVTNLVSDLAGKAPLSHIHAESEVTGLVSDLAGKLPTSSFSGLSRLSVAATAPASPGVGDLWVDIS